MKRLSLLSKATQVSLLVAATFGLLGVAVVFGEVTRQPNEKMWSAMGEGSLDRSAQRPGFPLAYRTMRLDRKSLSQVLAVAPMEFSGDANRNPIIYLPMPNGTMARFRFEESPIMEAALAREHPGIKTYSGQGIDDPTATARFDRTEFGLHAIVLSREGTAFIEPLSPLDATTYISYFNHDVSTAGLSISCLLSDAEIADAARRGTDLNRDSAAPAFVTGPTLRTYRLAVAATGEFTQQYGGGDVNATLAQIATLINQVAALYRKEATISFQLIANETSIIFTDPVTDGYTNDSPSTMLTENQDKLNAVIGSANYDIGHVFGGISVCSGCGSFSGIASLGVVCNSGLKGRGVSTMGGGSSSFPPSIFVNLVSHEIGHQFNAPHSFNSTTSGCSGNRDGTGSYEPGGGSTIMGYSTCGSDNLQTFPDFYFHTGSLEKIVTYAAGSGSCASTVTTGNSAPAIAALSNFTIPANTPFTLAAGAGDPNGDPLTGVWEEYDLGAASPPNNDDGTRPIFRSFTPASTASRTFPKLQYILDNANVPPSSYACGSGTCLTGESLPSTTRTMNFRFTARDNRAAGGGAANASMQLSVVSTAGPFAVTQPNTGITWTASSVRPVTWNVANTAAAPINCANVKISLSTDGGNSFPITLAANTPNDGSETVFVPSMPSTTTARVKVEAVGNVFFDISDTNFNINGAAPSPTPTGTPIPSVLGNISTRLRVEAGDNALIGGFIITGTQPKKVIVRAIGPSLSSFFPGVLANPILELHGPGAFVTITNDNWRSDQQAEIIATGVPPSNDLESAIVATLPANNAAYTAIVRGVSDTTGIGVVEAYDLDRTVDSKLGNISTRGLVQTGDNVMIGGMIVIGQSSLRVLVRAIGPSLPVSGALGDPTMELHDVNGALIAANNNWRSDQEAEIIATGIPPSNDLESAIVRNLAPGNYTAIVRGVNGTTGIAVVEAYGLN